MNICQTFQNGSRKLWNVKLFLENRKFCCRQILPLLCQRSRVPHRDNFFRLSSLVLPRKICKNCMPNGAIWGYLEYEIPPAEVGTSDVKFQGKMKKRSKALNFTNNDPCNITSSTTLAFILVLIVTVTGMIIMISYKNCVTIWIMVLYIF